MDIESPASPGPASSPVESAAKAEKPKPIPGVPVEYAANPARELIERCERFCEQQRAIDYNTPKYTEKYKRARSAFERFHRVASLGDVTAIYRNRPVWVGYTVPELIDQPWKSVCEIPSSLMSVLNYMGSLIHENTHVFFSAKENPKLATDFSSLQTANLTLLKNVTSYMEQCCNENALDVLRWCCSLASELSQQNSGRPCAANYRGPELFMDLLTTCPTIKQLIELLDITVTRLLDCCPDECMTVLFDASRHGSHFNWIWLHIAMKFPGSVVDHLFTVGAEQFKTYVEEIRHKEKLKVSPAVLAAHHDEYNIRFMSLSEMFNFLMRRGNIELKNIVSRMIVDGLDTDMKDGRSPNLNVVFFFKLVTCSVDTLRYLITQNKDLATPLNFVRGMRQILSVDKRLVLPNASYLDFGRQMIYALDYETQGLVLSVMANIAFDGSLLAGSGEKDAAVNKILTDGAAFAVEEIVNQVIRTVNSNECTVNPVDYPPIASFASGHKLQFLVNAAIVNKTWAPTIIRYLHCLCIAHGEQKGAEIVARFILTVEQGMDLSLVCAYLSAVTPFHPAIMDTVYANLFSVRRSFLEESERLHLSDFDVDCRMMNNLRTLLEWELSVESSSPLKYYSLNPGARLGELLTGLMSIANESVNKLLKEKKFAIAQKFFNNISRLLLVLAPVKVPAGVQLQKVLLPRRYAYKLATQLAAFLKLALSSVCEEYEQGVAVFEEVRAAIFQYYIDMCNPTMETFSRLFMESFIIDCLQSNQSLFGESVSLDPWVDPVVGHTTLREQDDDYSFLDALDKMSVKQKVVHLAHSGTLKKAGRSTLKTVQPTKDAFLRAHVFLDAIRTTCTIGAHSWAMMLTKVVAKSLVEMICQDALSQDFQFGDWDLEKEHIARYLEVTQRLDSSWLCRGLLNVFPEVPPCSWFCLPIIKAQLAVIVYRFESAVNKMSNPSTALVSQLDQWLLLVRKSDMLSEKFEILLDIIPRVSHYEGFLLLVEVWKYYQRRAITYPLVLEAFNSAKDKKDFAKYLREPPLEFDVTVFRLVIQRHIAKLGYLFPRLATNVDSEMELGEIDESNVLITA